MPTTEATTLVPQLLSHEAAVEQLYAYLAASRDSTRYRERAHTHRFVRERIDRMWSAGTETESTVGPTATMLSSPANSPEELLLAAEKIGLELARSVADRSDADEHFRALVRSALIPLICEHVALLEGELEAEAAESTLH